MAFRGHGGGRGYGRGGYGYGSNKQEPFILFPDVELPDKHAPSGQEMALIRWSSKLQSFWELSPYYIEDTQQKQSQKADKYIERFSDMNKPRNKFKRDSIWEFVQRTTLSFPGELIKGSDKGRGAARTPKKARWNPEQDQLKLEFFEKLEHKYENRDEKGDKEKKEGEDEDENEEAVAEEDEEFSDDGDYNQNIDFDDDEDDYNMEDDNDNEPIY